MIYRRRATALHAARAGPATAWLGAIGLAVLLQSNPIVLGALLGALLLAGVRAAAGRRLVRVAIYAACMGLAICVINALVTRAGFTVIWRFGNLPLIGQTNVTLEATVYGAILGLRAAELVLLGALYSFAVDPDQVLRGMRRVSFGSALSATIATRMVPILLRDARRLAEAQRCRLGPVPGRLALMRATTAGALDRALDVAATLEVRGYSYPGRRRTAPQVGRAAAVWSRHDFAFAAAAIAITAITVAAAVLGWAPFRAYPTIALPAGAGVWSVATALSCVILAPTLATRGVGL